MKKLDTGQLLGLIANLGVIAGILLLVFELQQNRIMMEAQTRHELTASLSDQLLAVAEDEAFSRAWSPDDSGLGEAPDVRYYCTLRRAAENGSDALEVVDPVSCASEGLSRAARIRTRKRSDA